MHKTKFGGRAPPGPVEDAEELLQTSYAVVVDAGNVPSDSLSAVRGCFLPWREEREVEGDRDDWGGSRREGRENVSITIIARDFMFNS